MAAIRFGARARAPGQHALASTVLASGTDLMFFANDGGIYRALDGFGGLTRRRPPPPARGMPRFYLVADHDQPAAVVRASATGQIISRVPLPSAIHPRS